jgi:hypothetical protein
MTWVTVQREEYQCRESSGLHDLALYCPRSKPGMRRLLRQINVEVEVADWRGAQLSRPEDNLAG